MEKNTHHQKIIRFEENWLCDWVVIIRLIVGEVEEIFNFERVFS